MTITSPLYTSDTRSLRARSFLLASAESDDASPRHCCTRAGADAADVAPRMCQSSCDILTLVFSAKTIACLWNDKDSFNSRRSTPHVYARQTVNNRNAYCAKLLMHVLLSTS